jgi:hypothetical protein
MSIRITPPFPTFTTLDGGNLENGFIYIGLANFNAETAPIPIFWDSACTITASQPIRTINGMPSREGAPSNFYTLATSYSMTVRDSAGGFVYSANV